LRAKERAIYNGQKMARDERRTGGPKKKKVERGGKRSLLGRRRLLFCEGLSIWVRRREEKGTRFPL